MITLILPAKAQVGGWGVDCVRGWGRGGGRRSGAQIALAQRMLTEEMGAAAKIKSRVNRYVYAWS
jgi:hypothetical protein